MKIFNLPDLGEGLPEAELREWYVEEGDYVEIDQPIASMETAKALVDIPAPESGYIFKRYAKSNEIVTTGAPLVSFKDCHPAEWRGLEKISCQPAFSAGQTPQQVRGDNTFSHAMPAVKALARKFNVDLTTVSPSSPNGSITVEDVKKAAQNIPHSEPLSGTRRTMAINMAKAYAEVVPAILCEDADIQAWNENEDYTLRLIRGIIVACKTEPALNAHYFNANLSRKLFTAINLGIAMDNTTGLYVPVLKNIAETKPNDLRKQINQFKHFAQTQSFSSELLTGASIVLSNFGSIGGRYAVPIIIPPIVAIIAAGRSRDQVVAVAGKPVVHKVIPLTLAFDHRAVTGGEAARFLMAIIEDLKLQS